MAKSRKNIYPYLHMKVKGNVFKNKHEALEDPHTQQPKRLERRLFGRNLRIRRTKNKATRERKFSRTQGVILPAVPQDSS